MALSSQEEKNLAFRNQGIEAGVPAFPVTIMLPVRRHHAFNLYNWALQGKRCLPVVGAAGLSLNYKLNLQPEHFGSQRNGR